MLNMKKNIIIHCIAFIVAMTFVCPAFASAQEQDARQKEELAALKDSISNLSARIEREPRNVELRLRKAALNIEAEQWQYALDEYSNVLDLQPQNLMALYYRGFVNQHLQRYNFARQDYESVLKYDPTNMYAHSGIILCNLADGRPTAAFDGANNLVALHPDAAMVYEVRSEVEEALGMTAAGIDDIEKAISLTEAEYNGNAIHLTLNDDLSSYYLKAFSLYVSNNERKKAKKCLDTLVKYGIAKAVLYDYYVQVR